MTEANDAASRLTDQILEVIKRLANERETFTSDDLRPLLPDGATPKQLPGACSRARRDGIIEEVGRVKSTVPESKGRLIAVYRRPGSAIGLVGSASSGGASKALIEADEELVSQAAKELDLLRSHLELNGYVIGINELASIILLLAGREWLILSGPSGTGKSSLVRHVCSAVGGKFHDVQVKPNWVSSDDSLGYFSEVGQVYVPGVLLSAFTEAQDAPDQLHFIRLDEMNLAPPEYYVAEVLSAAEEWHFESDKRWWSSEIQLPPSPVGVAIPKVRLASSVFMVGTVNVDETTKVLSPKVLDRAAVYDLHFVDLFAAPNPTASHASNDVFAAHELPQLLSLLRDRPRSLSVSGYGSDQLEAVANLLNALVDVATPLGGPIGYRQRDALVILLALSERHGLDSVLTRDSVLDLGVATCVMPKWQGSTPGAARALRRALEVLVEVDIPDDLSIDSVRPQVALCRFPRSAERILAMIEQYDQLGFFSAW